MLSDYAAEPIPISRSILNLRYRGRCPIKQRNREMNDTPTYFHLSGVPLANNSIIEPGNWGRVIRHRSWCHPLAIREMALEAARLERFQNKPSRLDCAFVFVDLGEAKWFRNHNQGFEVNILYEIQLATPEPEPFIANTNRVNPLPTDQLNPHWADAYWQGVDPSEQSVTQDGNSCQELLTKSQLIIKHRIR